MEEIAGIDVLCSDKTGTLTENRLTLGDPFCLDGVTPDEVLLAAALASRVESQDAIDVTVLGGLRDKTILSGYRTTHFQPFDPVHKRSEATVSGPDRAEFSVTKGAAQVILDLTGDDGLARKAVEAAVQGFAGRGFRALAVARTDDGQTWRVLGVLPLYDPPRADSKATLEAASHMGLHVKMVTGIRRRSRRRSRANWAWARTS